MIGAVRAGVSDHVRASKAAEILRACGSIQVDATVQFGDLIDSSAFAYAVGEFFSEEEGCITYKPSPEGVMTMIFTPFHHRDEILQLRDRVKVLESRSGSLPAGLLNAVSEYAMLLTLRAGQVDPGQPSDREQALYAQITASA